MDPLTVGLSVGAKVLGGIFGRKQQRKSAKQAQRAAQEAADRQYELQRQVALEERKYQEANQAKLRKQALEDDASRFTRLREGAIDAGFNPLTALMGGGTTQLPVIGINSPSMPLPSVIPLQDAWAGSNIWTDVLDAASSVMPEFTGQADIARAQDRLNMRLTELQIQNQEAFLNAGLNSLLPSATGGRGAVTAPTGASDSDDGKAPHNTIDSWRMFGIDIPTDQRFSDAEVLEARGGDLFAAFPGMIAPVADVLGYVGRIVGPPPVAGTANQLGLTVRDWAGNLWETARTLTLDYAIHDNPRESLGAYSGLSYEPAERGQPLRMTLGPEFLNP